MAMGLIKYAPFDKRYLIVFAILSAIVNGIVTAGVGAWLTQIYASYQARMQSIEGISRLFYARRTRAGMVVSSLRRNADVDEVRQRKLAYDEVYVDWNTSIRKNLFVIREVLGRREFARLEQRFEDDLVTTLSTMDACLTKAYDARMRGDDPVGILRDCRMAEHYQQALDCGATFTNELYKLSRLSFVPYMTVSEEERARAEALIAKGCARPQPQPSPNATAPEMAPAASAPNTTIAPPTASDAPASTASTAPAGRTTPGTGDPDAAAEVPTRVYPPLEQSAPVAAPTSRPL